MRLRTDFTDCITATDAVRIPFNDIDPAGVVWHGRYFKYFEAARCKLLESIGYSYDAMLDSGFIWPVVDTTVRYVRPLKLNQQVTVTAGLGEWEMRLIVDYAINDAAGTLYTKARTIQVPVTADTNELRIGCPDILIEKVRKRLDEVRHG